MFLYGIIFLAIGQGIGFYVGRREFYRRNEAGMEEFKNYTSAVTNKIFEKILSIIAGILSVFGIFLCIGGILAWMLGK